MSTGVALRTLAAMGKEARGALPAIRACLSSSDPLTRILAVEALWRVSGERRDDIIEEYLRYWRKWQYDEWTLERVAEACRVFGELGRPNEGALAALEELERFPGEIRRSVRTARARILGESGDASSR